MALEHRGDLLMEAVRPAPRQTDVDVVIGARGPIAPPEMAGGLMVPIVVFDQLYSFDIDTLVSSIPRPEKITAKAFQPAAEELFSLILQMADNAGATDEHRALNYLAVRYPAIYARTTAAHASNASLTTVDVRPSRLSGVRKVVDVVFAYTHRQTDVTERYFVRVDVTEEFPFLVTKLSPYYER
jgi:PatG C-terminal